MQPSRCRLQRIDTDAASQPLVVCCAPRTMVTGSFIRVGRYTHHLLGLKAPWSQFVHVGHDDVFDHSRQPPVHVSMPSVSQWSRPKEIIGCPMVTRQWTASLYQTESEVHLSPYARWRQVRWRRMLRRMRNRLSGTQIRRIYFSTKSIHSAGYPVSVLQYEKKDIVELSFACIIPSTDALPRAHLTAALAHTQPIHAAISTT